MQEYKGLKVVELRDTIKNNNKNLLANYKDGTITLYREFFNRSELVRKQAIFHEYSHSIWHKLPRTYKIVWKLISNAKLLPLLNAFGITKYKKNAFARMYGEKNYKEDFATLGGELERQRLEGYKAFNSYVDFKLEVVHSLLSKYK